MFEDMLQIKVFIFFNFFLSPTLKIKLVMHLVRQLL